MSKVILITGGSSGIGKSIGEHLSSRGFRVYGTSRNPSKYANESTFPLLSMSVNDVNSIDEAVSHIITEEGKIDVLINNAGVGITGPVEETPDSEIIQAFDTNFVGPLRVIKAVLPGMRAQKKGLIINITSIAAYMGLPYRGVYSATKSALEIITEALRMETRQFGISITNLAPGDFATNIASGRYHSPLLDDSPYRKDYGNTLEMMNEHVNQGEDPLKVAIMVERIINTSRPRIHYKVGAFLQRFSVFLKRVLPDRWYERMLLNHYKLK